MKYLILFILILFTGCTNTMTEGRRWHGDIDVIEYDSCEYIVFWNGQATWGSHKGNCKFCQQRNQKQ